MLDLMDSVTAYSRHFPPEQVFIGSVILAGLLITVLVRTLLKV